ncbi:hypothetical protein TL16_g03874 [Triparma laevis f. inornata]|uniref:choline-phosphate cytidylyltransferase n=2 Tax=Triparma laevis TaxID=1534972 RepID=A0A9W7KYL5_9STRA|nr:hypothetical protein TL16_g03874 [Triparma laevis f. inornata]GMI16638.1 hypothetical protein TrLO_g6286 [Triparma laevis f. longispina]
MSSHPPPPPLGPKPLLLTNKQISALFRTLSDLTLALKKLNVDWVVTGGSLLGCIRQEGVLFCDDDIDIAIISEESYAIVREKLSETIGKDYAYKVEAWEGGDKLRPRYSDVFIDIFCLRDYKNEEELKNVIGIKKNGQAQSSDYVNDILNKINTAVLNGNGSYPPLYPLYHFSSRKAIEMWPKEVYRTCELLPIRKDMRFGPVLGVGGPRCWKLLLERAFGSDCFEVYYESVRHSGSNGGMWEMSEKTELKDEHYIPIQPLLKKERVESSHNKESLFKWLEREEKIESCWLTLPEGKKRTVYMDGVFDLFHVGHLEAIKQARRLGDFLILGVTGDKDAEGYKRRPVICEEDRCCVLRELKDVGEVLCPCPLIVTEEFMKSKGIDLVVHGFKNYEDAEKQREFFEWPMEVGRFELIQYSNKASTSEILERIVSERILEMEVKGVDTKKKNPEWFGASVASVTNDSAELPRPFTAELEEVIMKHVEKAMVNSNKALEKIESEVVGFRNVLDRFMGSEISREGTFEFDTEKHNIVAAFLEAAKLEKDYDLARMHEGEGEKER